MIVCNTFKSSSKEPIIFSAIFIITISPLLLSPFLAFRSFFHSSFWALWHFTAEMCALFFLPFSPRVWNASRLIKTRKISSTLFFFLVQFHVDEKSWILRWKDEEKKQCTIQVDDSAPTFDDIRVSIPPVVWRVTSSHYCCDEGSGKKFHNWQKKERERERERKSILVKFRRHFSSCGAPNSLPDNTQQPRSEAIFYLIFICPLPTTSKKKTKERDVNPIERNRAKIRVDSERLRKWKNNFSTRRTTENIFHFSLFRHISAVLTSFDVSDFLHAILGKYTRKKK